MCGLVGFIDFQSKSSEQVLIKMNKTLYHRGPDDGGISFYTKTKFQIGIAHRRLSILDLSNLGHQPMKFDNFEIVYNGEIYNFQEIKNELQKHSYKFDSNSDTEVILKAFHKWGVSAINKFIGMFAFCIYDKKLEKMYLFRDRVGVKPLYYYSNNGLFLFSSELKSFHCHPKFEKEIDFNGLSSFFRYGYILAPYTIFKNVKKLDPGCYIEYDLNKKTYEIKKYWDVYDYYNKPKLKIEEKEALDELEKLLDSAFSYRMISDVPVGIFLSGGYDSTCVASLLQKNTNKKIKTFTIGFNVKGFNEAPFAKKYAEILGTDHFEYYCTEQDAIDIIPSLPDIYDEPFGDSSAISTILVSKIAKQYVDVVLSADGSDEIFAGYNKHFSESKRYEYFSKIPNVLRQAIIAGLPIINNDYLELLNNKTIKIPNYKNKMNKLTDMMKNVSLENIFKRSNYYFTNFEISKLIKRDFDQTTAFDTMNKLNHFNDNISKILAVDYKTYLVDDILTKVDRATMSVSLEGREPFLDHRIIEYVAQLPIELKYKNNKPKYLIKEIVHKYIPKEIIDKPKRGFSVPITEWYDGKLNDLFLTYISEESLREVGILDENEVSKILRRYNNGEKFLIKNIWFIFIFQLWAKRWL